MNLKEKCIYYIPSKDGYYLVLSISNMVYGRYGDLKNPNYLDVYMNQNNTGLKFKIDNIIIEMESYRNYALDNEELDEFVLVKELTDEEFDPMELLILSRHKYPSTIIDIHKNMNDISIMNTVHLLKQKKSELIKLSKDIYKLETKLYMEMSK